MSLSIVSLGDVMRVIGKILYWLLVLAISVALLVALVLFFESRDQSQVEGASGPPSGLRG